MADPYDEIARRFFNQFLELKVQLDLGRLTKPENYDKTLANYRTANERLKGAAADLAAENQKLEEALALAEEREAQLRGQLNEALINLQSLKAKYAPVARDVAEYRLREHLSEESRRALDSLMREIPRPGGSV